MRPQEKTKMRIDIATRAVIAALEAFDKKSTGQCIVKSKLFTNVERRAGWIMEDKYDPLFDSESIAPPNANFLGNHWPDIIKEAAGKYKKYIVWEPRVGVRLGTFDEFQETRELLQTIAKGLADNIEGRDRIIVMQGGVPYQIEIRIKQLPMSSVTD